MSDAWLCSSTFVCCLQSAGMPHNLHCIFTSLEGTCPLTYEALSSMRPCAVFGLHSAIEMGRYTVTCCLLDACRVSLLLNLSRRSNRSDQLQHWQMLGVEAAPQSIQTAQPFSMIMLKLGRAGVEGFSYLLFLYADLEHLQGTLAGQSCRIQLSWQTN